jgi:hypothetical protein
MISNQDDIVATAMFLASPVVHNIIGQAYNVRGGLVWRGLNSFGSGGVVLSQSARCSRSVRESLPRCLLRITEIAVSASVVIGALASRTYASPGLIVFIVAK